MTGLGPSSPRLSRLSAVTSRCAVKSENIKSFYLGKIAEAEEKVATAPDVETEEHWRKILNGYRSLAGLPLTDTNSRRPI